MGRQVQLLVEDSANDVGTGVQKTRKLIDRDKVDVILGDVNSGIAYAMSQVTSEKKVFHIVPGGHTDPITGANCKWNVFRVCNTTTMDANAVTPELVKKFGKKWFFITPDYAYGHTLQDAFVKALKKAGGTYEGDMLPINNTDFSATLIKAKGYKPNVLLNNMGGLTQINCMKQFTQFGMQKEMALGGALFELESIKGCPPDAQTGWWDMEWWWNQPKVPEVGEVRRRLPRRDQEDAIGARLVRLRVDAFGAARGREGEVARRSEAGGGDGGYGTAAGRGAAARQGALSQGRSRIDAQHLRRRRASAKGQRQGRRLHARNAGAGRAGGRYGRGNRVQDDASGLIRRSLRQHSNVKQRRMTQVILFNVTNGLIIGAFYVLMALGLSLILNLSNVINFAHGNFLALGGYLAFTLSPTLGYWGALLVSPLLTAMIGSDRRAADDPPRL